MIDVDPQLQDHAVGLEMEIVEVARRADQAAHEGWPGEEAELRGELNELYGELATVAEQITGDPNRSPTGAEVDAEPAAARLAG